MCALLSLNCLIGFLILVRVVFREFKSVIIDPSNFVGNKLVKGFWVGEYHTRNVPVGHSLENAFHGARFVSVVDGVISSVIHKLAEFSQRGMN